MAQDQDKLDEYAISNEGILLLEIIKRLGLGAGGPGFATEATLQAVLTELQNKTDRELVRDEFTAIADNVGIGYSVGDHLSRISYFDISGGSSTLIDTFWFNHTTDSIISAPVDTEIVGEDSAIVPTPGVGEAVITTDGNTNLPFDCHNLLIENKASTDIGITVNGVLGSPVTVLKNTSKVISFDVPNITDFDINGIMAGSVFVTYSRNK